MTMELIIIVTVSSVGFLVLVMIFTCVCQRSRRRIQERQAEQVQAQNQQTWSFIVPAKNDNNYGFDPEVDLEYDTNCQICFDLMDGKSTISKLHPCNHAFHKNCIYQWFATQYNEINTYRCTICRDECPQQLLLKY
jgi:hypothetical protein